MEPISLIIAALGAGAIAAAKDTAGTALTYSPALKGGDSGVISNK